MFAALAFIFGVGFMLGSTVQGVDDAQAQSADRVFELRTYTTPEGKLPNLQARFRDHSMSLFEGHGITNIGYFTPQDEPNSSNTLVYIIAHPSREAAETNWGGLPGRSRMAACEPRIPGRRADSERCGISVPRSDRLFAHQVIGTEPGHESARAMIPR